MPAEQTTNKQPQKSFRSPPLHPFVPFNSRLGRKTGIIHSVGESTVKIDDALRSIFHSSLASRVGQRREIQEYAHPCRCTLDCPLHNLTYSRECNFFFFFFSFSFFSRSVPSSRGFVTVPPRFSRNFLSAVHLSRDPP